MLCFVCCAQLFAKVADPIPPPTFLSSPNRPPPTSYQSNPYGATLVAINGRAPALSPTVRDAVALQLDRIQAAALTGVPGARADSTAACAMGAAAAAFLMARRRALLPALSEAAGRQLEVAAARALAQTFADHVDPMAYDPMVAPEAASDAAASASDGSGSGAAAAAPPSGARAAAAAAGAMFADADPAAVEAALKIQRNRDAILADIAAKSGLARPTPSAYGRTLLSSNGGAPVLLPAVREAVDTHLRRLAALLLVRAPPRRSCFALAINTRPHLPPVLPIARATPPLSHSSPILSHHSRTTPDRTPNRPATWAPRPTRPRPPRSAPPRSPSSATARRRRAT